MSRNAFHHYLPPRAKPPEVLSGVSITLIAGEEEMLFQVRDSLSIVPDEGWAPKKKLRGIVSAVANDRSGRPAYFVITADGEKFWLTARGAIESSGMVFHAESSPAKVPDPESGHGFVFVAREEAIQAPETTRGK